jgi:hypothetical protein
LSDFCRRRRTTTKCVSCSWQCKRKFIKIIKINNQNAACKQSGSNLVMPMEKSYMDIFMQQQLQSSHSRFLTSDGYGWKDGSSSCVMSVQCLFV